MAAPDVAAVEALCAAATAEIAALRGGPRYPVRTLPAPGDADHPVWIGEVEGTVVGYLAASRSAPARANPTAGANPATGVIDAVYVDAGCRGIGVGAAMLDAALAWMAAAGCDSVDAFVLPGARQTKNFFEEAGLTARLLVVHRRL